MFLLHASSIFFIFLETKFFKHYGPKVRATLLLVLSWLELPGRSLRDKRQGHLSSWSEQSRPKCWGWKSQVRVPLSYGLVSSSYTLDYGSIDLGTHFAKGIVKIVSPVSSKFNPFQKISRWGQETFSKLLGGTKVSLDSEGSPRPVCDSLSEVSSR